ncbi:MAG: SRPBCC family protein [Telluria sp.]
MIATNDSKEIRITRIYDAPLQAVWHAWADPAQVEQWWGPRGFSLTTHSKDLRSGGHWHYTMHGPDGTDYPNRTAYLEVEPQARLVYDHGAGDGRPPMFRVTVEFAEADGKTRMEMRMTLPSAEAAAQARQFIKQAGGDATWDRLAEHLAKQVSNEDKFYINRSFDAPLDTMFDMWTKPEHIARWLAPAGFDTHFFRANIKTGGSTFCRMASPSFTIHGTFQYEEVRRPDRIVYMQQFCDENENVTRHPMAPDWPQAFRTTIELNAEGPDRTRVTVSSEVAGEATAGERAAFAGARAGMTQGWTGSFDKLDEVLAARAGATA